jgi:hypothetical protein
MNTRYGRIKGVCKLTAEVRAEIEKQRAQNIPIRRIADNLGIKLGSICSYLYQVRPHLQNLTEEERIRVAEFEAARITQPTTKLKREEYLAQFTRKGQTTGVFLPSNLFGLR